MDAFDVSDSDLWRLRDIVKRELRELGYFDSDLDG